MEWISVEDRLPQKLTMVALVDIGRWLNVPFYTNVYEVGYLNNINGHGDFWSTVGTRYAQKLNAFTHWMPLPDPPKEKTDE